jgi:predicted secreted protein
LWVAHAAAHEPLPGAKGNNKMARSKLTTAVAVCTLTLVLAAVAACGSSSSSSTPAPAATYTEANNLKTVTGTVGQTVSIELNENQAEGFAWKATVSLGIKIVSSTYTAPAKNATPAYKSGLRTWVLEFTQSGTQKFSATYAHGSGTPASPATPQIQLTIKVQ